MVRVYEPGIQRYRYCRWCNHVDCVRYLNSAPDP